MKKIGIITLYFKNYNYGGLLQAFALQKICEEMGMHAEQIRYDFKAGRNEKINLKYRLKGYLKNLIHIKKKYDLDKIKKQRLEEIQTRNKLFENFEESISHSDNIYNFCNVSSTKYNYDILICGGDQIWNDWGLREEVLHDFTLEYADKKKTFSYAASFGIDSLSNYHMKNLQPGILKLNGVSVREKSAVKLIEQIGRFDAEVVVDPVLLLTKDKWNQLLRSCSLKKEKYVFSYFLGDLSGQHNTLQCWINKQGFKNLIYPHLDRVRMEDENWGDIKLYCGPREFVETIKNASLVITDSYHAVVFSVIYNVEFYVLKRNTQVAGKDMNTRIIDFLDDYNLGNRLVSIEDLASLDLKKKIDYNIVNNILEKKRTDSFLFLKKYLGVNE